MYFVKYGKEYLHDPRVEDCFLLDLSFECDENSCGYCDFTIYPDHPMHDKLRERDAYNPVEVYDDDMLLFSGFIYELGQEFYTEGQVKCKGELDYLRESIVRPYSTVQRGYGSKAPDTVDGYFAWLISQHNNQVNENKRFTVGVNQGAFLVSNNLIFRENNDYPTTIDEISDQLLNHDSIGGYIRTRHENGIRYIDYLSEWTDTNTQIFDFGINLTDYTQTDDSDSIATFIVPLGAPMSDTEYPYNDGYFKTSDETMDLEKEYYTKSYNQSSKIAQFAEGVTYYEKYVQTFPTSDSSPVEGIEYYTRKTDDKGQYSYEKQDISKFLSGVTYYEQEDYYMETTDRFPTDEKTYYTMSEGYSKVSGLGRFRKLDEYYEYSEDLDESSLPLTLVGSADGSYDEQGYIKLNDMVYSLDATDKYGWIGVTYKDSDITVKEDLRKVATTALKKYVSPKRTIEIKAVDMHLVNPEMKPIKIGEYVRVRSKPHNLDSYFICTSISLDLNNPENSLYTLGNTYDTLTGEQNKRINVLNRFINTQYDAVAAISKEAKAAAKEAAMSIGPIRIDAQKAKEAADSAVASVEEEYAVSGSEITVPTGGWSKETPTRSAGTYIWKRTTTTYGSGYVAIGDPVLVTGNDGKSGEDATVLRIDSSRGTVFKNNSMSTVLSVCVYRGSERITNISELHSAFGAASYLQWSWQRIDESEFGIISSTDPMLSNDGFSLTISADNVDTKITFMCELIV